MPNARMARLIRRREAVIRTLSRGFPLHMANFARRHTIRVRARHRAGINAEGFKHKPLTQTTLNARQHGAYEKRSALGKTPLFARGVLARSFAPTEIWPHGFECTYDEGHRTDSEKTNRELALIHAEGRVIPVTKRARKHLALAHNIRIKKSAVILPSRISSGFDQEENDRMLAIINHAHLEPLWR